MKSRLILLLLGVSVLLSFGQAQTSNVPTLISYSGKVVDASGNPITAQRLMTFRIWDHPTNTAASNRFWSEQQTVVINAGEFSVLIGSGSAVAGETNSGTFADAFNGSNRYLGVTVDDGTSAVDPEISPRQQIVTTAFAFRSRVAETVASQGITSAMLSAAAVNEASIASAAVSTAKIADLAIQSTKLADGSVTTTKIADGAVTSAKLASGQVSASVLADASLTTAKLADGAITSAKIADGTILLQDLAANSVDASKLTDGAVTVNKHADNSVSTVKIIDGAVTTTKIADLSVTNVKIADGSITTAKLGAGSVTLEKVAANAIDRSKLHPSVQASLRRPPEIYDQLVSPNYAPFNTWGVYGQLLPIDIENLGNDADGCRIVIIGKHRSGWGLTSYDAEWNVSEVVINLGQSGMNDNGEITSGQYIMGDAKWTNDNGVYHDYFFLGITDLSWGYEAWHYVGNSRDSWYQLRTYYPGSLASQLAAPWNANQQNNASNSAAGGPPVDMNINSVTAENGVVTVVTRTGHAIQKTDVVTIAGVTGAGGSSLPDPNGQRTVTAVPSRNSFQFALAGANGTYTGGWVPTLDGAGFERLPAAGYQVVPGYAKVTYKPTYSKYRLWLSVHRNTSARVIVYDN